MKVALLFSGEARFCKDFDSQLENLLGADQIDWYCLFWNKTNEDDQRISPFWDLTDPMGFIKQHLPKNHSIQHFETANTSLVKPIPQEYPPFYIPSSLGMWEQYQALKIINSRIAIPEYDLVIRTRPDIGLDRPLDLRAIQKQLVTMPSAIVIPKNERRAKEPQFCDQFAIGIPETMNKYANAVDLFDWAFKQGIPWNPEWIMQHVLASQSIIWPMTEFEIILRKEGRWVPNGKGWDDFYPDFGRWTI